MEGNPLVSVIINCFNGEEFLREAIDSVLAQTYTHWEIIFWDNQSTDATAEIVKSYTDSRIRYYYAPNHTPLGEARNLAVEKTKGEYINFLDADDIWMPNKLEEQIKLIEPGVCEVVYSPFEIKLYRDRYINKAMLHFLQKIKCYNPKASEVYKRLLHFNWIAFSSVLFNRKLYIEVGGVDPRFQQNEDLHLLIKCSLITKFGRTNNVNCIYRIYGGNNSNKIWRLGLDENKMIFSELPDSKYVREAIRRNNTRIGFYLITKDRKVKEGLTLLIKKGSLFELFTLLFEKICRYV